MHNNAAASGINEVQGEREKLLEVIVLAIDEVDERRRTEQDERTELDKRLLAAGEEIREKAAARKTSEKRAEFRKLRKKRAIVVDLDEEEKDLMEDHIVARREV